ncbi:MAG TPA: S-type pyocin domain-containing protein [Pseudomonas sp.]|uniref:S-type pyocin domain-containing protein n=1 Tax=Pseudomonas sp. TaxID=306 RepID=UPI002B4594D2|nr:S-type pyocin domain-containing protein [Pseudomonas sp.]HKS11945.1 S-type pyocin domain-containing protein [Pseudomonas sp.]
MQQNVVFLDYTHVIATPYLDFPIPPLFPFNLPHWPYLGGAGFPPNFPEPAQPAAPGPIEIADEIKERTRASRFPQAIDLSAGVEAEIELHATQNPGSKPVEVRRKEAVDELFLIKYHQSMNQDALAKALLGHDPLSKTTATNVARYEELYGSTTLDNESFKNRLEASYSAAWARAQLTLDAYLLYIKAFDVSHEQLILGRVANASPDEIRKRVRERIVAEAAAKAEAERIAAEAAAKAEAERIAAENVAIATRAGQAVRVFNNGANVQLGTAAGAITLASASGLTLEAAFQSGLNALKGAAGVVIDRALGVGIGAFFYSPMLGNGELSPESALSMPLGHLLPEVPADLNEIAAKQGQISLPYRIHGSRQGYTLVATPASGLVDSKIPVRAVSFEPTTNSYISSSPHTLPIRLTFPATKPGDSSTTTPGQPISPQPYTGVVLTPLAAKPEALPIAEPLDFRDCIYCFPVDSGLAPIYIVFSNAYEGATTRGEYSGRLYNPEKAGGPTLDLDWTSAAVTQAGIDLVRLHTSRFRPSDANEIMIERLEKIVRGDILFTDVDKRFYTHELRELERFRALGIPDGFLNEDSPDWNNTHTATLEDYKLVDAFDLFYTPDAIEADDKQIEREQI